MYTCTTCILVWCCNNDVIVGSALCTGEGEGGKLGGVTQSGMEHKNVAVGLHSLLIANASKRKAIAPNEKQQGGVGCRYALWYDMMEYGRTKWLIPLLW